MSDSLVQFATAVVQLLTAVVALIAAGYTAKCARRRGTARRRKVR